MKNIHKSVLIWYSPEQMFALVTDVANYPQFLPWCDRAEVLEHTPDGMLAKLGLRVAGLNPSFTTRNSHVPPHSVRMALVDGPFSQLAGEWTFGPVGDGSQAACKVSLSLQYGFSSAALAMCVGPVFDKIADGLVNAFIERAQRVYG